VAEPRTFVIRTFGCQMNEHDSERIAGLLQSEGMEPAARLEDADVVVLNTCTIRENADNKLYGHLGLLKALKDARPDLQIAVGGCMAQKDRGLIQERAPYVDAVFGTHNVANAARLLDKARSSGPQLEILEESAEFPSALPAQRDLAYSAWVTIQIGCNNACAFCIVPSVRGKEISRPFDEIVDEITALAASGTTEVTLLGQNVNSYGRDITKRGPLFAELLRQVGAIEGIERVRYTSPHPKDLRPETIEAMADTPTVMPHLHLPLQSGSDVVLKAMHRGYTAERYLDRLRAARQHVPDLAVTTDLIVGFPGETDDDFERTLETVAEAEYDSAYTFIFSPRPGTEAAAHTKSFIDPQTTAERFERLKVVVERSARHKHAARIGRTESVLVEGPSKKDPDVLTGRTPQNKLTHFRAAPGTTIAPGSYADVRITAAAAHYLTGELEAVTAKPRHKTRIPVAAL
jgi:tRNA-2-methylthio-N6-dimethylallyladenosine synthase